MEKEYIDKEAFDNIKVWECHVTSHDDNEHVSLKRTMKVEHSGFSDDRIEISQILGDGKEGVIRFPTDSAYILATALNMMQDNE